MADEIPVLLLPISPLIGPQKVTQSFGGPNEIDDPDSTLYDSHNGYLYYSVDIDVDEGADALSIASGIVVDA